MLRFPWLAAQLARPTHRQPPAVVSGNGAAVSPQPSVPSGAAIV